MSFAGKKGAPKRALKLPPPAVKIATPPPEGGNSADVAPSSPRDVSDTQGRAPSRAISERLPASKASPSALYASDGAYRHEVGSPNATVSPYIHRESPPRAVAGTPERIILRVQIKTYLRKLGVFSDYEWSLDYYLYSSDNAFMPDPATEVSLHFHNEQTVYLVPKREAFNASTMMSPRLASAPPLHGGTGNRGRGGGGAAATRAAEVRSVLGQRLSAEWSPQGSTASSSGVGLQKARSAVVASPRKRGGVAARRNGGLTGMPRVDSNDRATGGDIAAPIARGRLCEQCHAAAAVVRAKLTLPKSGGGAQQSMLCRACMKDVLATSKRKGVAVSSQSTVATSAASSTSCDDTAGTDHESDLILAEWSPAMLADGSERSIEQSTKAERADKAAPVPSIPLHGAAQRGDVKLIRQLLLAGAKSNVEEPLNGITPVMWAAAGGHVDAIKVLVRKGADINKQSHSGSTALIYAVRKNQAAAVAILIDLKADVHIRDRNNWGALVHAATKGNKEIMEMLLRAGADAHALDQPMLLVAARFNHADCVRLLLDWGADATLANNLGMTAADLTDNVDIKKMVLDAVEEPMPDVRTLVTHVKVGPIDRARKLRWTDDTTVELVLDIAKAWLAKKDKQYKHVQLKAEHIVRRPDGKDDLRALQRDDYLDLAGIKHHGQILITEADIDGSSALKKSKSRRHMRNKRRGSKDDASELVSESAGGTLSEVVSIDERGDGDGGKRRHRRRREDKDKDKDKSKRDKDNGDKHGSERRSIHRSTTPLDNEQETAAVGSVDDHDEAEDESDGSISAEEVGLTPNIPELPPADLVKAKSKAKPAEKRAPLTPRK